VSAAELTHAKGAVAPGQIAPQIRGDAIDIEALIGTNVDDFEIPALPGVRHGAGFYHRKTARRIASGEVRWTHGREFGSVLREDRSRTIHSRRTYEVDTR
jgi:hypothetical protein